MFKDGRLVFIAGRTSVDYCSVAAQTCLNEKLLLYSADGSLFHTVKCEREAPLPD